MQKNTLFKRVALHEAPSKSIQSHHATQTYGLCAVVLPQVKANGLVQSYGLSLPPLLRRYWKEESDKKKKHRFHNTVDESAYSH
ncbi:MAG: hypothetical protein IKX56_07845 [Muribaculaceae bacterium]|nr:hypothetical protein [Muribaculaceae bacterium]